MSDPIQDFELAKLGQKANTAKEAIAEVVGKQNEALLKKIATCIPDLGTYSRLAGELSANLKILKAFELSISQAKEAVDRLKAS